MYKAGYQVIQGIESVRVSSWSSYQLIKGRYSKSKVSLIFCVVANALLRLPTLVSSSPALASPLRLLVQVERYLYFSPSCAPIAAAPHAFHLALPRSFLLIPNSAASDLRLG